MDEQSTGVAEVSAPVEETTVVESPTTEETVEQVDTQEVETDQEGQETEAEATEQGDETDKPLAQKSQNRFQKLANENRELKEKLAELESLQVPTEQDYIDGGYDPLEAKVNAIEASYNRDREIDRITTLNNAIDNDMVRIVHEFPQLDPKSPEFNRDLAVRLFAQFDEDAAAEYTDNGITLKTNQLPYQYISNKMELIGLASAKAKIEAQKSVESMVAAAETPGSKAPPATQKDPSQMTAKELEAQLGMVYM